MALEKKDDTEDLSSYEAWAQELEAEHEAAWYDHGQKRRQEDCNKKKMFKV